MTENKILGGVVPHALRRILALGIKYRVQHAPVDLLDNWIAQIRKDVPQAEGQLSACLEQIVWQGLQISILQAENHHQICVFTLIPA